MSFLFGISATARVNNRFADRNNAYRSKPSLSNTVFRTRARFVDCRLAHPYRLTAGVIIDGISLRVNDLRGTIESAGLARNRARFLGVKRPVVSSTGSPSLSMQSWCFLSGNRSLGTDMCRSPVLGDVVNRRHLGKVVINEIEDVFA